MRRLRPKREGIMMGSSKFLHNVLRERSDPKEIAMGVGIAYALTAIGLLGVGLASGGGGAVIRTVLMLMFLTIAPLISFVGLGAEGSAPFTIVALLIYIGLWVFAVKKLSGLMLRVAVVILVGSWMLFGIWAASSVY